MVYNKDMNYREAYKRLERIVKGFANHRRIEILYLLDSEPELSVDEISEKIRSEFKNVSSHVTKMAMAGLVKKRSEGNMVRHSLTPLGKAILKFVRILE